MSISFLIFSLIAVIIQGFFAFFEMAAVSFNKVRLQYYVSIGSKRALWLEYLLQKPSRLFVTTLIGITASLFIGSECSRRFYESIGLNPDWSAITQFPIVVIFGELAPMFAGRRHPEQAAMFCVPFIIVFAKILTPITWSFDALAQLIQRSKKKEISLFLSREEIKLAFEERKDEFNEAVGQIFNLKNLIAGELMTPLDQMKVASSNLTIAELKKMPYFDAEIPIFHRFTRNIVGIVYLRDLLAMADNKTVMDAAKSPWFVTRDTAILHLLQQFRRNNQRIAVILDPSGQACGLLTLDQILAAIFGEEERGEERAGKLGYYVERTLSAEMSVREFNQKFHASLPQHHGDTLSDLLLAHLDHLPVKDEVVRVGEFEFMIDEPSLMGIKIVSVKSVS